VYKKFVSFPVLRLFVGPGLLLFLVSFGLLACISTGNRCEACGPPPGYNPDATPIVDANGILYYIAHKTLYAFQDGTGALLWRYTNPALDFDTPAVSDGRVYLDMDIANSSSSDKNGVWVYALSGDTGRVLWRTLISASLPEINPAEPQIIGGIVYAQSSGTTYGSTLFALRGSDGKVLWSEKSGSDGESPIFEFATPQIAYLNTSSSNANNVLARRVSDGTLLWYRVYPSCHAYVESIVNKTLYISIVCANSGGVDAVQAETGQLFWHVSLPDGLVSTTPTNTVVYIDDAANPSPGTDRFFAVDANSGQLLWRRDIPQQSVGANTRIWAANEDAVYTTINGIWYALAARDGQQIWKFPSSSQFTIDPIEPIYMRSWLLSPPLVYIPANQQLNAFQASTGKLKWQFGLPAGERWNINILFYQGVIYLSASILKPQTVQQNLLKQDVYAIQAATGKVLWHSAQVEEGQVVTQYGVYFAVVAGQPYHYIYGILALQADSGKPMWMHQV
jgi:outer membrane protein assembly factor BamB